MDIVLAWVLINVLSRKNNNPTKPAEVEVNWSVASQRQFIVVHPFKSWWQLCPMTLGHATELKMLCGSKSLLQSVVRLCPCGPGHFRMQGLLFRTEARVQPKDGGKSTGRFLHVARVCPCSLCYSHQWAFCSTDISTSMLAHAADVWCYVWLYCLSVNFSQIFWQWASVWHMGYPMS